MKKLYTVFFTSLTFAACTFLSGKLQAQTVTTFAGATASGTTDATGTAARFNYPAAITSDGTNLYIADNINNEIRKVVISTGVVTTLAGSSTSGSTDGTGTAAKFNSPQGIAYDGNGNLFVADASNNKIRKIVISSGVVTTFAGSLSPGSADGTGTAATFHAPFGIAADGNGNLFVADLFNNEIRQIVISSAAVTTLAGTTFSGSFDGTGAGARFNGPTGVAADASGNIYVADNGNNDIRKIVVSSGVVTTLAGSTSSGSSDGSGSSAGFYQPTGLTCDASGNLYVADSYNNEIRQIVTSSASVTTFAGNGTLGSMDGTGAAARFNFPTGCVIAGGALYIADASNNEIRKSTISTAGIHNLSDPSSVSVYPNPASEMLYVKFSQPSVSIDVLKIMDLSGREISSEYVTTQQCLMSVDVSSLPKGVYFLNLQCTNGEVITGKFVK